MEGKEREPWKGICCRACYFAEHPKCRCSCRGIHHGKGKNKKLEEPEENEREEALVVEAAS